MKLMKNLGMKKKQMIKLKSLIFEEKTKIHSLVSNWKNKKAQDYASKLIEKYGEPDVEGGEMFTT